MFARWGIPTIVSEMTFAQSDTLTASHRASCVALVEIGRRWLVAGTIRAQLNDRGERDGLLGATLRLRLVRRRLDRMVKFLKAITLANSDSGDLVPLKLDRQDPIPRAEF